MVLKRSKFHRVVNAIYNQQTNRFDKIINDTYLVRMYRNKFAMFTIVTDFMIQLNIVLGFDVHKGRGRFGTYILGSWYFRCS